jgi:methyl-accepting chemotaxis protein
VSKAVQQMDQVTQQNAANAEETASASEKMSVQTESLMEQIETLSSMVGGKGEGTLDTHKKTPVRTSHQIAYRHDVKPTTKVKGNGHGTTELEALIPMGENRIEEHDEHLKDF